MAPSFPLCLKAFREMSHKFHGKGSGKKKLERRMKKVKDEQVNFSGVTVCKKGVGGCVVGFLVKREVTERKTTLW